MYSFTDPMYMDSLFFDPVFNLVFYTFIFAIAILHILGIALTFRKAGEQWWKALIPFYGEWTVAKIARAPKSWFWIWLSSIIVAMIPFTIGIVMIVFGAYEAAMGFGGEEVVLIGVLLTLFGSMILLVSVVFWMMILHKVSKAFGQDIGFTVGFFFLEPVFFMILGLNDKIQYQPEVDPQQMQYRVPGAPAPQPYGETPLQQGAFGQAPYGQAAYGQQPASGQQFSTAPLTAENPGGISKGAVVGYVLLILVPIFACCIALSFMSDLMNQATMGGMGSGW